MKVYEPISNRNYQHCYKKMTELLDDDRFPIDMDPAVRKYFIPSMWPHKFKMAICYCPWCGKKLPKILEKEYFEILQNSYGTTNTAKKIVPAEFTNERWWVKRKL